MVWNKQAECMSKEEKEKLQLERLQQTVKLAYNNVSFYKEKFDEAGITPEDIKTLKDIEKIPFTTKDDLRAAYPFGLFAVPYEEIVEIPDGYEKAELKDFEDGKLLRGRPEMSSVTSYTFDDDGEEKTINRFKLYIFQDEDQLYIEINVNLKNDGDIHKNIRKGSVLFDFITSILELENAGSVGKSNIIRNVNLKEYREFVNQVK